MTSRFRLAPVIQSDIPSLGRIFAEAFSKDLLRRFIFTHGPDLDLSIINSTGRYENDFAKPSTRFLKAVDDNSAEIVGFITWTMIENQQDEEEREFPPPLNNKFNKAVFGGLQRRRIDTMRGKIHIRECTAVSCLVSERTNSRAW